MSADDIPSPESVSSDKLQKINEKECDQFKQQVDQQTKKILATKKSGEKSEDLPGSDIPSLEEFVKARGEKQEGRGEEGEKGAQEEQEAAKEGKEEEEENEEKDRQNRQE